MVSAVFNLSLIAERIEFGEFAAELLKSTDDASKERRNLLLEVMTGQLVTSQQAQRVTAMDAKSSVVVLRFIQALRLNRPPSQQEMDQIVAHATLFGQRYLNAYSSFGRYFPLEAVFGSGKLQRTVPLLPLYDQILPVSQPFDLMAGNAAKSEILLKDGCISAAQKAAYDNHINKRRAALELGIILSLRNQGITAFDNTLMDEIHKAGERFSIAVRDNYNVVRDYKTLSAPAP